jgi:hypothetical protein
MSGTDVIAVIRSRLPPSLPGPDAWVTNFVTLPAGDPLTDDDRQLLTGHLDQIRVGSQVSICPDPTWWTALTDAPDRIWQAGDDLAVASTGQLLDHIHRPARRRPRWPWHRKTRP